MYWRMVYTSILRYLPMALVDGLGQCHIRKSLQTLRLETCGLRTEHV